jgi:hypothetical protein
MTAIDLARRRGAARAAALAALAALPCACAAPLTAEPPPARAGACAELAYIFHFVAEKKDRGSTQAELLEALRAGSETPFASHPEQSYQELARVVELVYRRPEANARQIEAAVRAQCSVDENGQPVLRALWPRSARGS